MTSEEILSMFTQSRALLEGHFQLTSGLHSPQYFQCAKVLQYPKNTDLLCGAIAKAFKTRGVDVVIAPALGGIVVGQEVGRQLNVRTMFAERKDGRLQLRRGFEITRGEQVLVCEDVITTGGSVQEVITIVQQQGGIVLGVGAIVDRSGGKNNLPNLFSTMKMDVVTYKPEECPMCKRGEPVDKPGSREQLTSSKIQ
ncbi:MAG: orotate phosphoribosyltransferase [Ignavibacteria bacterium]|nr:orotate phosphoribosyltransferase [Ignavibacteria bacterium]MBI3765413.1 orotate phosphoribosyltransferase [Ignavibacteriales bacterium]